MLFNSLNFFLFIVFIFIAYPRLHLRGQNIFLLVMSYLFYGYWDWRFTFLLFILTLIDFWIGQKIQTSESQRSRKLLLFLSVAVNLSILGFFKYYNFFIESAASVLSAVGFNPHIPVLRVILPIGISFYIFKTLTYTSDIYRRRITASEDFINYALFLSFFPQLLAGPIDRASALLPQIASPRLITREKVLTGLNLVLLGFFKKVAIADSLAPIVGKIFDASDAMSGGQLWTGVYAYTFQIYGDFSGYTDIARGISRILGFESVENFNAPYLSKNITEFWQRWHISLSTWFRDYLYIPLGGNRQGNVRTYANLVITMLLCGLWHGAAWTFILWGLLHGIYLMGHRMIMSGRQISYSWPRSFSGRATRVVQVILTFHLVALAWVLFRASSLESALGYYAGLLFRFDRLSDISAPVLLAGSLMIALDIAQIKCANHSWLMDRRYLRVLRYGVAQLLFLSVLCAAVAHLGTVTPFIYFQF